jgi:hypothetical protein
MGLFGKLLRARRWTKCIEEAPVYIDTALPALLRFFLHPHTLMGKPKASKGRESTPSKTNSSLQYLVLAVGIGVIGVIECA